MANTSAQPWECHFCHEPVYLDPDVSKMRLVVHHLDDNRENDDFDNLVASHWTCHNSHHNKGKTISSEHRAAVSKALSGRSLTDEHKAKLSKALKGRVVSEESKRKFQETILARRGKDGLGRSVRR